MTDISVIILVGKEKIHMRQCMEKLAPLEQMDDAPCALIGGKTAKFIKNRMLKG